MEGKNEVICERISVIVPIYNTEKYLARCIESILCQTYTNLEIILVDDGSTDKSGDICDFYARKDNRVKVVHKENGGAAAARNFALNMVTGQYIGFVDSDDTINFDTISECVRLIEEENADLVMGGYSGIGEKGYLRWSIIPQGVKCYTGIELLEKKENGVPVGYVWSSLYKKSLWKDVRFPVGYKYEDSWTTPEILIKAKEVVTYPGSIYNYYENEGSFMHSEMTVKEYQMRLALYDHLILLYEENKLPKKMIECMEIYMNHFDIWRKRGVIFEQKYIERNNEIVKKYICKTKGIPLQRKIKVIIKQSLKRLNQKNGIRE